MSLFDRFPFMNKPQTSDPLHDLASLWWDVEGPFKILHTLLPLRMEWFLKILKARSLPVSGARILDVGCGGGLFCEPLARLGALITGIDVSENAIASARQHQEQLNIDYLCADFQDPEFQKSWRLSDPENFDVICLFEVLEHVCNPVSFLQCCVRRLNPGGIIVGSTLNRTMMSWMFGIGFAEFVAGWVPKHTHHISGFIKPHEVKVLMQSLRVSPFFFEGLCFHVLKKEWYFSPEMPINYFFSGVLETD
jgi:2-polyprenyl-6-hydroxyphenyl methylase / 3-demethylubiquinone-9 3-methyltransferase